MTDMLAKGIAWLNDQRKQSMSFPVIYKRGEDVLASELMVTAVGPEAASEGEHASVIESRGELFVFAAGDLSVKPNRGDEMVTADEKTFSVVGLGNGESDWEFEDSYQTMIRVRVEEM